MTTTPQIRRVAIVGGGIAGLSTAWYLERQAAAQGVDLAYTLLESGMRWGGKILTEQVDSDGDSPFIIEAGPDSFLTQKPWALQLAHELGLGGQLLGTNDGQRSTYVLKHGRPVVLPDGLMLIVPTRLLPFVRSPLLSPWGKLRMGLDWLMPARRDDADETLAQFVRRRLGREALDKIAEPLLSGIYNADAERQSILATFPRFRHIEREHGSLIRGMLAARRGRENTPAPGEKLSAFMSFAAGTQTLVDALAAQLGGDLRLETGVNRIEQLPGGGYTLHLDDGRTSQADAVVLATPAPSSAELVRDLAPAAAALLEAIRYVSTGTISLAYRKADLPHLLKGFGLVIPGSEQRPINAITIASTKFDQRAPADSVLLRVFFGGARSAESMQLDDAALLRMVRAELCGILGIEAEPRFHRIYRWWNANPQYDVGHLERVARIEATLPPGLYVTGSAYRGVGMPDCVHQAQQTAEKLIHDEALEQVTTR